MAKAEQLQNTAELASGFDRFRRNRALGSPQQRALHETREAMEQPRSEATGDGSPDGAEQTDYDVGYACTPERRSGTTKPMPVEGGMVGFHIPTVDACIDLAQILQDKQQAGESALEVYPWFKNTLASWAVESEHDEAYWGEQDPGTLRALIHGLQAGGNVNRRSAG